MKITLWFAAALILVVGLTYAVILSVSRQVIQKTIRDGLIETVTYNIDEIEFYSAIGEAEIANDVDYYVHYGDGYLEIDDDFLNEVNDIYTSLCQSDGTLVYGENPIARETVDIAFTHDEVQKVRVDGTLYYVYDRQLDQEGLEGLWLRGVVSEEQGEVEMSAISRISLIVLPSLVLLAIIGGYIIASRALMPIREISGAAAQIREGNDLKQRLDLGEGKDEVHQLAEQFNGMFARLDDSFQAQQQFVSDASHELRTPVAVINAQCELTLEQERSAEEYEEALRVIKRQGRKMNRLISELLDFTRLELQPQRYAKERLNMTALVESICYDMALIQDKGITLTCEAETDVSVMGNYELLSRMLTNLISNAYRYGKPEGHIKVKLFIEDKLEETEDNSVIRSMIAGRRLGRVNEEQAENVGYTADESEMGYRKVILAVVDDGIGIAKEERENIFRRFYQVDESRTGSGSGLGLAMVREIAQFHGGEVSVESELGKGSIFTVRF